MEVEVFRERKNEYSLVSFLQDLIVPLAAFSPVQLLSGLDFPPRREQRSRAELLQRAFRMRSLPSSELAEVMHPALSRGLPAHLPPELQRLPPLPGLPKFAAASEFAVPFTPLPKGPGGAKLEAIGEEEDGDEDFLIED